MCFTGPMRILFVGNSFTGRNDLPGLIRELAAALPQPVTVETSQILVNGASLRQHWNKGEAKAQIEAGGWDYVVLQEQSTLPIKNAVRYHENVRLFAELLKEREIPGLLYLTWARTSAPESQALLNDATEAIGQETGLAVVPVGRVWEAFLAAHPEVPLHDADGSHPAPMGSYLAACVFVDRLTGQKPGAALPKSLSKLSPEQAAVVREFAASAPG